MQKREMNAGDPAQRLAELRQALLKLHKTLVDSERESYEKTIGAIPSQYRFLELLIRDPWFAGLQPVWQLLVVMDETLEQKESLSRAGVEALVKSTCLLLVVSESGEGVSRHYFDAMQRDPDVVRAHAEVSKLIKPLKPSNPKPGHA